MIRPPQVGAIREIRFAPIGDVRHSLGRAYYERSLKQKAEGGTPPATGAALCAFLLSAASDGISGKLISAIWDPWRDLLTRRSELSESDI